jgi:glycosyltransferase involved in cell wall biosynthesis
MIYHHRTRGEGVEGTHIRGIADSFARRGWKVEIVSPPGIRVEGSAKPEKRERSRSTVWRVVSDHSPQLLFELLELSYNFYSMGRLPRTLRATDAKLIYERYALFNWAATWIARRKHIPIVLEINDATVIVRSRPLFFKRLAEATERWTFRNATHLITVSEAFRNQICERHGISRDRVRVMPNAIDPLRFATATIPKDEPRASVVLGMVAAFVRWHGVEFLIRSVSPFLSAGHLKLLLVGDGPERTTLETWIDRLNVRHCVELTGAVPASDVPKFLDRMDVCVMANSNEHGSPMKIFEYMAAGKPVLAPAYGPIREIITHKVDGWLFEPLQSSSLREGLEALVHNPELRRRLGAAAQQTVLSKHTWDHRVNEVEAWFTSTT